MRRFGAYEAKTHFAQLLDAVERGETITITRHGATVAVLAPPPHEEGQDIDAIIAELKELRSTISLGGLSIRAMIEEGRA